MLIRLFEEQVNKNPDKIAIKEAETSLTYFQLNQDANRVAGIIESQWPETARAGAVCLLFSCGTEMIAAILGVLKAGKVYVPLSTGYPVNRISYILGDCGVPIIITDPDNEAAAAKAAQENHVICINTSEINHSQPSARRDIVAGPPEAAYIMYTSGSTGRPKGVVQNHDHVIHFIRNWNKIFSITASDRLTLLSSFSHDASVMDIYAALLSGATLYPFNPQDRNLDLELADFIIKEKITIWHSVPTVYNHFVNMLDGNEDFTRLRYIILGGEAVREHEINMFQKYFPLSVLANVYGQTESSVNSIWLVRPGDARRKVIIGEPIDQTKIFLVNEQGKEASALETGEIVIASPYVSSGYWNNEKATKEQFTNDPVFGNLYWTGDLGRLLMDGTIEFLGRKDFQVKIRGYRIEPGEIETQLLRHKYIKEAAVTVKTNANGEPYLAAYYVGDPSVEDEKKTGAAELRRHLSEELPDYMIPSYFIQLERLPLTRTGKIDRKALPEPAIEAGSDYTAPGTEIEKKLVAIWSKVLEIEKEVIGTNRNFFELGGHSLNATIVIAKIYKELGVKIPLPEFFKRQTINGLYRYIAKEQSRPARDTESRSRLDDRIRPVEKREYYNLSPAQERLYFLRQMDTLGTAYNMPLVLTLQTDTVKNKLETTLKKLTARHESLRTSFIMVEGRPVQRVHDEVEVKVKVEEEEEGSKNIKGTRGLAPLPEGPALSLISSLIRPFDLSQAPLLRSRIIKRPDGQYTWVVDVHHIVSDGTSHTILIDDFISLYNNEDPGPLPIQYKDFTQWQEHFRTRETIKIQENYWLNLFADAKEIPRLQLPTDYQRPRVFTFAGNHCSFNLDSGDALKFKQLSHRHNGTLYMNTLAALNTLFYKYTGQTDIIIGSGGAGRPHENLWPIVGMFVNTLAMRNYPDGDKTYEDFLQEVIARSTGALENQDVQFEELVEKLEVKRDPAHHPLFDIFMISRNFTGPGQRRAREEALRRVDPGLAPHKQSASTFYRNPTSKFDLLFFIDEQEQDVSIIIEYYTGIFKPDTVTRLVSHFKKVVKTVIETPGVRIKNIEIITPQEKKQVLYEFNHTAREFPGDKTLHELFALQVEKTPLQIALAYNNSKITYKELEERSNRVAYFLKSHSDIAIKGMVGILVDRSILLIEAIFGVLKAGGAYVPISSTTPAQRLKIIIHDSRLGFVISQKKHLEMLSRLQWECDSFQGFLCMDSTAVYREEEQESQLQDDKLWDYIGETGSDEISAGGWQSSYTGEPFSKKEMHEHKENVYKKLSPLLHQEMRVLEIGCSTGLTMYRLAPAVKSYHGTDFSGVVIRLNREQVKKQGHTNITLSRLAAHEIDQIEEKDFHLVIINSVVQYFHGYNYLRKVIGKAIDCMNRQGYLFIGDIIDHELKEELIRDLQAFKQANPDKAIKTKTDWNWELFVSRGFLEDLTLEFPVISKIEFSKKIHTIQNELTRFRFDALITVDKSRDNSPVKNRGKQKNQYDTTALTRQQTRTPLPKTTPNHLAYIIYTSGSTGQPKGVMIQHRSVVNFITGMTDLIDFRVNDKVLCLTDISFDIFGLETFVPLTRGTTIIIGSQHRQAEPASILRLLCKEKTTIFQATPSRLQLLLAFHKTEALKSLSILRYLLVGGEAFPQELSQQLGPTLAENRVIIYNLYGPTETTIWSTTKNLIPQTSITIGKPIANTMIYILDKYLNPVPPGIAAEICIAGTGLARGYLNQPELTERKFCLRRPGGRFLKKLPPWTPRKNFSLEGTRGLAPLPDRKAPGNRISNRSHQSYRSYRSHLYKTGDLGRWLADGNIEFLGRLDFQVKIRGHRIELAEIESHLLNCNPIKEAVVTDNQNEIGDKYLTAYFVSDKSFETRELTEYLGQQLPAYMIPSCFIQLDSIPLTVSGKVDRQALPSPDNREPQTGTPFNPPETEEEKIIASIWGDFLGMDKIGINNNFFTIGGHSLLAVRVISRIREIFNLEVSLAIFFDNPTVKQLADAVTQMKIETVGKQEMEKIFTRLEDMTDQEAEQLLNQLNG